MIFIDASNIKAGGGVTHLKELLRCADPLKAGFTEVIVAAPDHTLDKIEDRWWLVKHSHSYLNSTYFHRLWWLLFILSGEVKSRQAILFIPGTGKPFFRWPYITMCRNLLPLDYKELFRFGLSATTLRLLLLRVIHLDAFRHAKGVIFLTKYCYDILPHAVKASIPSYEVIPHGINHELFDGKVREGAINDSFTLLYISIVNNYKHQDKVAKAVVRLNEMGFPIRLTLIGPSYGPALKRLKRIIDQHTDVISYEGKLPYEQLALAYNSHDGFIMASTCETFCMILTEAMAMGMPIICSSKSSLPETLGDAGIYFDPEDGLSIESAILQLMKDNKLRERLSLKAIERASGFDWKKCSEQTFRFIARVSNR